MIDLGTLPEDSSSNAYYVNSRGQVVGTSEDRQHMLIGVGEHAFLWEDNGPMVDLNTLIPADSSLQLTYAVAINDRGEIAGFGVPSRRTTAAVVDEIIHGDCLNVHCPVESCGLAFLNPPYDWTAGEIRSERTERVFLAHTYRWLKTGGVLVLVVPAVHVRECGEDPCLAV